MTDKKRIIADTITKLLSGVIPGVKEASIIYGGVKEITKKDPFEKAFEESIEKVREKHEEYFAVFDILLEKPDEFLKTEVDVIDRETFCKILSDKGVIEEVASELCDEITNRFEKIIKDAAKKKPEVFYSYVVEDLESKSVKLDEIKKIVENLSKFTGIDPARSKEILLEACQSQVNKEVDDRVGKKYIPSLYINRGIEKEFDLFASNGVEETEKPLKNKNCFLIIDRAGSGKTNLLCSLAKKYSKNQPTVLILGNLHLQNEFSIEERIKILLEYDPRIMFLNFQDCMNTLNEVAEKEGTNFLVFIDGINENSNTELMKKALENILSKHIDEKIKFCITCRDIYWEFFKAELFWDNYVEKEIHNRLYQFKESEFSDALEKYFEHFEIKGKLVDEAEEKCKHPLLLRFYCEAFKGTDVGEVTDIRLGELFDTYWKKKIESIAQRLPDQLHAKRRVEDYLLSIAREMMDSYERFIPHSRLGDVTGEKDIYDINSIYTKILDEDIILEEEIEEGKREGIVFVYEEFMEYVMARDLMNRWRDKDETGIGEEIDKLADNVYQFMSIFGIMVYLSIMLKKERKLSIWRLLTGKGERWQKIVCEGIKKLSEEELDKEVFDVLHDLSLSKQVGLRVDVADIFKLKRIIDAMPDEALQTLEVLVNDDDRRVSGRAVTALKNIIVK